MLVADVYFCFVLFWCCFAVSFIFLCNQYNRVEWLCAERCTWARNYKITGVRSVNWSSKSLITRALLRQNDKSIDFSFYQYGQLFSCGNTQCQRIAGDGDGDDNDWQCWQAGTIINEEVYYNQHWNMQSKVTFSNAQFFNFAKHFSVPFE